MSPTQKSVIRFYRSFGTDELIRHHARAAGICAETRNDHLQGERNDIALALRARAEEGDAVAMAWRDAA